MSFEHRVRQQQRRENPPLQTWHRFAGTSKREQDVRWSENGRRGARCFFHVYVTTTRFSVAPRHSVAQ